MKTIRTLLLCTSLLAGTVTAQESSLVLSNGLGFVDTPYKAGTLEVDDTEDLIINCDEVDCTTFVEYALAMALCPQQGDEMQEGDFARNLQRIRYRDGKIDGYTSRLHYIRLDQQCSPPRPARRCNGCLQPLQTKTVALVHEYASGTLQIVEKFSGERSPNGKV